MLKKERINKIISSIEEEKKREEKEKIKAKKELDFRNEKKAFMKESNLISFKILETLAKWLKSINDSVNNIEKPKEEVKVKNLKEINNIEVKVNNLKDINIPEPLKKIEVSNLKDIPSVEIPKEFEIREPKWFSFKSVLDKLSEIKQAILKEKNTDLDKYTTKSNPLAVRLVNRDKTGYYDAMGGGGGIRGIGGEAPKATAANQDTEIALLQQIENNTDNELAVATNMEGGGKISVGVAAVEATFAGSTKSIIISADSANTGTLYIGKSNVTSAGANAIAFLEPGESIVLDYDESTNFLYVVASVAAQNFWKGALIS